MGTTLNTTRRRSSTAAGVSLRRNSSSPSITYDDGVSPGCTLADTNTQCVLLLVPAPTPPAPAEEGVSDAPPDDASNARFSGDEIVRRSTRRFSSVLVRRSRCKNGSFRAVRRDRNSCKSVYVYLSQDRGRAKRGVNNEQQGGEHTRMAS